MQPGLQFIVFSPALRNSCRLEDKESRIPRCEVRPRSWLSVKDNFGVVNSASSMK